MDLLDKVVKLKAEDWQAPEVIGEIPHGDMPGDKVEIGQGHIDKAKLIFPKLLDEIEKVCNEGAKKAVITVCGGSGVGKSEIASLLSFYLNQAGIGSYTLSGDNYPRRIPMYNDAERLRLFRQSGIHKMISDGVYTSEAMDVVRRFQEEGKDADVKLADQFPWFGSYIEGGIEGLKGYLGTDNETNFKEVEEIVAQFKAGQKDIYLKRMGRTDSELWYSKINFRDIEVLIIEWTHGNSDKYKGVDIPILLNSTPEETLAHRQARNRDGKTDSPFTMRVLEVEQKLLHDQAHKAKIIVSKDGQLLSFEEYSKLMEGKF